MPLPAPPTSLPPFATHLSFFASSATRALPLALLSSLRGGLALGLDFPVALVLAISLRFLYASPSTLFLKPADVASLPPQKQRTQLEHVDTSILSTSNREHGLSFREVMGHTRGMGMVDKMHVAMFWNLSADKTSRLVSIDDLRSFQKGTLMWDLAQRRRYRSNGQVLPLWRGGPISVTGHSWFVNKLFDVQVYQADDVSRSTSRKRE